MGWRIILDNDCMNVQDEVVEVEETNGKTKSRVGKGTKEYNGGTSLCRVGDDDGNIYYIAVCDDDESMENFFDWSIGYAGASWSDYWCTKENKWKGFIS